MSRTIVAIGCSTDARYAFLAPLTALFWREVIGHHPRVFLLGNEAEWVAKPYLCTVLEAFRHHGLDHVFFDRIEGYPDSTLAQNVRQHAACDPGIAADDWVMMSDADLWPLQRELYYQHVHSNHKAILYYANGDHFQGREETFRRVKDKRAYQSIPTCSVTMRAENWRRMYGLTPGALAFSMQRTISAYLGPKTAEAGYDVGTETWMSDQRCMTEKLCAQDWFPDTRLDDKNRDDAFSVGGVLFVTRLGHPPANRLDRMLGLRFQWEAPYTPEKWVDAHLFDDPFVEVSWNFELKLVDAHLPQHAAWARAYRDAFVGGL